MSSDPIIAVVEDDEDIRSNVCLYLGQSDLSLAFGPVASLAVVMAWVYYAALAFLAGAVLAAASDSADAGGRRHPRQCRCGA